jgi:hypothetical protein
VGGCVCSKGSRVLPVDLHPTIFVYVGFQYFGNVSISV